MHAGTTEGKVCAEGGSFPAKPHRQPHASAFLLGSPSGTNKSPPPPPLVFGVVFWGSGKLLNPKPSVFVFHNESFGCRLLCVALNCRTFWDISCLCYTQDMEVIMEKCEDQSGLFNPLEASFHFLTSKSLNRTTCTLLTEKQGFSLAFPPVSSVSTRFFRLLCCNK